MPTILITDNFFSFFNKLPKEIRGKVLKTIRLLSDNPKHPSLRSKPVKGAPGIFEASIDMHYRLTYERLPGDQLSLRVVGNHDDVLKNP